MNVSWPLVSSFSCVVYLYSTQVFNYSCVYRIWSKSMVHAFRLRTPFQAAAVFLEQARCKNIHAKILRISEQYTHPLVALYFPPDSIGIPPPFARHLETGGIAWLFSPNFIESSGISSAHKKYRPQTSSPCTLGWNRQRRCTQSNFPYSYFLL